MEDPKAVFYRVHADRKQYHYLDVDVINRGTITRILDTRHLNLLPIQWRVQIGEDKSFIKKLKSQSTNLNPTPLFLLQNDEFGLNTLGVNYSLSKHKRWQFTEHFIENFQAYQHPNQRVSTILATSEAPFRKDYDISKIFENPRPWSADDARQLKYLVASNNDGLLIVRENQKSRGFLNTFLRQVINDPLPIRSIENKNQEASKKPNRKLSKKQRQKIESTELEPIRIAYHVTEPHISLNHLNGSKESRWNGNSIAFCRKYYGPSWRRKTRLSTKNKFPPLDPKFYAKSINFDDSEFEEDEKNDEFNDLDQSIRPKLLTLSDFMEENLVENEVADKLEKDLCLNDYVLVNEQ